jgi:large subunit ribosomal protein L23
MTDKTTKLKISKRIKNNRGTEVTRKKNSNAGNNVNGGISRPEQAEELIRQPYITEKTFNMIERENKLTFIVSDKANKKNIAESLERLYASEISEVNTSRTVRGKKAVVKFENSEGARDLATKLGLV